ncbi:hypothetical protein Skr01_73400 [Sphaerisporangium krabiense]|uniref:Putative dithiol-disulfide oxidoreductase (DUF899 family) n=1 Tax=Sphaerisporangium krabiense TaxID=763782 RepID=A0A7W8Z910_9ACTN|nr:DUF899 domain-containing protein [Sphaerisporangium krabiense]MBB5629597.1 putative dithiol-disulfide oxidoreductase (DUF899 family) [Sphaerisporangium krabiense]GII67255.1 hypothetical protein Skr01_73400 [Sphaerisporangium krabiense]
METPSIVSRAEWLAARRELLAQEKELTRARDAVAARRRALPMVEITKDYVFEGPDGKARLLDLFEGRRQLLTYHFMWMHDSDLGCTSCSFLVDNVGDVRHLHGCDTTLALVSRAPLASLERFRARMGWTLPWYSSHASDFNYDFHVTADEDVAPAEYNYMDKETLEGKGLGFFVAKGQDAHGISVFLRDGDRVFHTYSTYGRGPDLLLTTYNYLDLTPLGRQKYVNEFPHHDTYDAPAPHACH